MTTDKRTLYFALGPVQSFFAQSRRTRDLWSGSFLVSYLSACAVDAFEEAGVRVVLPDVTEDRLVAAVRAVRRNGEEAVFEEPPEIGSVPNQLRIEADDPVAAARAAERRVLDAWTRITDAVWDRIAPATDLGRGTREIWERQVGSFWQIYWAVGGAGALARRKAWRGTAREPEPGDKCTLMAGWQELSGFERARERHEQNGFWDAVRRQLQRELGTFDLSEDERLCALALVKRLFPSVAAEAVGWELDTVHWPSTPYLAARPWLEDVLLHGDAAVRDDAEFYAELIVGETKPAHRQEQGAERIRLGHPELEGSAFLHLGGTYVFRNDLRFKDCTPFADEGLDREEVADWLKEVYGKAAAAGCRGQPSAFYALLQIDGDRLGELFGGSEDPSRISAALARFGQGAESLVRERGGLTVYAGGDDLVAFLPLPTALTTTAELAALYERTLGDAVGSRVTTSASLVFAHCRAPLRSVVAEGHRMLEEDAKESNGRGSIAVAVWKGSGVTARWVTTWEHLVPGWESAVATDSGERPDHRIGAVSARLGGDEVSASFLYGQCDVLTRLAGVEPWRPGLTVELPAGVEAEVLVRAELARARDEDPDAVSDPARELTELMEPGRRGDDGRSVVTAGRLTFDPLLLARFLTVESPGE